MIDFNEITQMNITNSWVTIGSFDGVHRGHKELISNLVLKAHQNRSPAVVVTFSPHPAVFFKRAPLNYSLTTNEERESLLREIGVDSVITLNFNLELANTSASEFIQRLEKDLQLKKLFVGYNFALGHGRTGDVSTLKQFGKTMGFDVEVFDPVKVDNEIISSSLIRSLLQEGQIQRANKMLGRAYSLEGPVIHGEHRGNKLGFATANLQLPPDRMLPAKGVYACRAFVEGKIFQAVTNIGIRPTFENPLQNPRVEPHILDLQEDLYGKTLKIELLDFLRAEQTFSSPGALIEQVNRDIQKTRELFANGE
jgi:riboflavin kinase / FMN adenylyltransferase